ncbi:MAG TPA: hypothetical protein VGQ79_07975 [Nitrospiraceae bacterium]|jgi:hypothetical protein|nr:hypothetical protein [Nitrospiraceae bacterium]
MPPSPPSRHAKIAPRGVRCLREDKSVHEGEEFTWRTETYVPSASPKDEQGYLDARKALCASPAFRREIKRLRERYPASFWEQPIDESNRAWLDAHRLCERWKIQGTDWVFSLIQNWDPDKEELPPPDPLRDQFAVPRPELVLGDWILQIHHFQEKGLPERPHNAVLTLRAGVSLREAQQAADWAVKELGKVTKAKAARPGLTEIDREILHSLFKCLMLPSKGPYAEMIRQVTQITSEKGRPMSRSTVARELRAWRSAQGFRVNRYLTDKRDIRQ